MDHEQFRRSGHEFVDWIADYMDSVESLPVMSQVKPGEIQARLPAEPPRQGEPMDRIFGDFKTIILPGITHWQHPGWHAYFPANNSPASVLAELLTAGLGAQCMSWQTSPAAAELENRVLEWLRGMLGLPDNLQGVIQDSASTATLCALISAREKATGFESNEKGLKRSLTVYASRQTHSSVEKGVKIAGYGRENLRFVDTDSAFAMIPEKLEEAVRRDRAAGLRPACVVATLGTTSSAAVDPLRAIGEIAARHGMWLHVDAAYAGTAALCPENRWMLDGAELMDSFVFNPHKWMLTNFDCSAYYVKEPEYLVRAFEIHPEYLKTGVDPFVRNYRDWGVQLGRRFRALKLWFVIRSYGVEGLQAFVREHLRLARMFAAWVDSTPDFEILAPLHFGVVCFRLNDGRGEDGLTALNKTLLERLNTSGKVFLTHTILDGKFTLRMVIGQRLTAERHVRAAWDLIRATAAALLEAVPEDAPKTAPEAFPGASASKAVPPSAVGSLPATRLILSGPRLELVSCDLDLIEMIMNDKSALAAALNATVPDGWPLSPEVQPLFRDLLKSDSSASGWLGYAAILRSERLLVGDVGFLGPPDPAGSVEIGYSVVAGRRGRGYASEMVGILIRRAFEDERLCRITAHTDSDNEASMRVLEKNGFERAGTSAFLDQGDKIGWVLERKDTRLL